MDKKISAFSKMDKNMINSKNKIVIVKMLILFAFGDFSTVNTFYLTVRGL